MKTQTRIHDTRIRFRRLPALAAPLPATARTARLPFLECPPEEAGHDLMVLNPRPDLAETPETGERPPPRGAFFEIMLG